MAPGHILRSTLAGLVGGLLAGLVDFGLGSGLTRTFLPEGRLGLLFFLCGSYALTGALAMFVIGVITSLLGNATDLGLLFEAEPARADDEARIHSARWSAYIAAALCALGAHHVGVRRFTEDALTRYHNRLLISAVVGAVAALLAVVGAITVAALARLLSPAIPLGPRVAPRRRAPLALTVASIVASLWLAAGGVFALLHALIGNPKMTPALRALNTSIWAPPIGLGALLLGYLATRALGRLPWLHPPGTAARFLSRPLVAVGFGWLTLIAPLGLATALYWETLRQLDARPWLALAILLIVATALLASGAGRARSATMRAPLRAVAVLAMISIALGVMLLSGRSGRVRKAASASTGLVPPLLHLLHAATDLDRDGYSSVLGGGDCDDLDRRVHPAAFDWPDDGIDQNCNGHAARLPERSTAATSRLPATAPSKPNILLLTIDALRADHVGAYGYARPTTPNLDALAREASLFVNGWAHAPSTRYSIPAILTGRYPSTIAVGSSWWPPNVLPENRLLAEMLKDLGYHTAAFLPYYYFNRAWGLDQGFEVYDISLEKLHSMGGDPAATRGSSARQLADALIAYIDRAPTEKPFFLWGHFYDTHFHFERHSELPEASFGDTEIDLYDGEIRFTDHQVGRVLAALKARGLWDSTAIVVTSDHGEGFGEHGIPKNRRHGYHLYRTETKIPLLVRAPGLAPLRVETPVGHVDLAPTLVELAGGDLSKEEQLLGASLVPLMLGGHTPVAAEGAPFVFQEVWYEGPTSKKAVVTPRWHYVRNLVPEDSSELYDLVEDPAEEDERSDRGLAVERELGLELARWMDTVSLPRDFRRRVEGNISSTPIATPIALGDRIGDSLVVAGVDLSTPVLRPGGKLELAIVFQVLGEVDAGWRLFTHVTGPGGRMINADHEPLEGMFPIANARAGQWLRDRVAVQIPSTWPAGLVHVDVGLWRRSARMPARGAHSAGDAVRVATMELRISP